MVDSLEFKNEGKFKYIETDVPGTPLILLHGLMGALSNFEGLINYFGNDQKIVFPLLPIFDMPLKDVSIEGLVDFIEEFIEYKGYTEVHLLGNSLGGHLAQLYALNHPEKVVTLTLTGSSGLFENAMGSTFPKRGNYEYIKAKAESVFYDPSVATKELVDEVFDIVTDLGKAIRVVKTAKSAVRHNLEDKLKDLKTPVLLVWGHDDEVTPLWVGEKFHELLPNSELVIIDKCGHAPMMEKPELFNIELSKFLHKHKA